jgi:hypothetical protein
VLLATSEGCPHQAYRIGKCVYAFQFHVEVTEAMINDWCREYFEAPDPALTQKAKDMIEKYKRIKGSFINQSYAIYEKFAALIEERQHMLEPPLIHQSPKSLTGASNVSERSGVGKEKPSQG